MLCVVSVIILALANCGPVFAFRRLPSFEIPDEDELDHDGVRRGLTGRNVDVPIPETPDGHLVTDLPLLDEGTFPTKHWAGLLPASSTGDKYFFYWLFAPDLSNLETTIDDGDIPLLIWYAQSTHVGSDRSTLCLPILLLFVLFVSFSPL